MKMITIILLAMLICMPLVLAQETKPDTSFMGWLFNSFSNLWEYWFKGSVVQTTFNDPTLQTNKINIDFSNSQIKTGNFIVQSQSGIDSYYDVSFEKIPDSTNIKINYCITKDKLIEAQKIKDYKDYNPKDVKVSKIDSITKVKTENKVNLESTKTKDNKDENCITYIENPYLVDQVKLGDNSTYIIPESTVFESGVLTNNVTLESNFSHLTIIGDTSSPWRGFNYTTRQSYLPYFIDDDNSYYVGTGAVDGFTNSSVNLNFTNTGFTFSAWVYQNKLSTEFLGSNLGNTWCGSTSLARVDCAFGNTVADSGRIGGSNKNVFTVNIWHHIVVSMNSSNFTSLYVDGILDFNETMTNPSFNWGKMKIGCDASNTCLNGSVDNVEVFNRSLSLAEVQNIYSYGRKSMNWSIPDLYSSWIFDNPNVTVVPDGSDILGNNMTFQGTAKYGYDSLGLVAYYPFDVQENVSFNKTYDYSLNNNDGTKYANTTWTTNSIYGGAYNYTGVTGNGIDLGSDIIKIGDATVCAWIYPVGWGNGATGRIVSNGKFVFTMTQSSSALNLYSAGTGTFASAPNTITLNQLQHVCVTRNATNMLNATATFYVNGLVNGTANQNSGVPTMGSTNARIGCDSSTDSAGRQFNGTIDEVMIFNRVLSSTEILNIYNNQSQRFKSAGTQTIKQLNITSGNNQVNLTLDGYSRPFNSNISVRLGQWDTSLGYNNSDMNTLNGLVSYWHFDNMTNNATLTTGIIGNAFQANLTNWISIPAFNTSIKFAGAQITYEAWIKAKNNGAANTLQQIVGGVSTGDQYTPFGGLVINTVGNNNRDRAYFSGGYNGTAYNYAGGTKVVTDGNWHQLVGFCNSSGLYLYIDGALDGSFVDGKGCNNGPTDALGTKPAIANMWGGSNSWQAVLNGSIDEVRVWNRALSPKEIANLYSNESIGQYDPNMNRTGLLAEYHLDNFTNGYQFQDTANLSNLGTIYSPINVVTPNSMTSNSNYAFGTMLTSGYYNNSLKFDGYSSVINVIQNLGTNVNVSGSIWVNVLSTAEGGVFQPPGFGEFFVSAGKFNYYDTKCTPIQLVLPVGTVTTGVWTNLAFVYVANSSGNIGTMSLYNNGVLSGTQYCNISVSGTSGLIGRYANRYFNGYMDEYLLFNRSLSQSEVSELYVKGRANWNYTSYQNITSINSFDNSSANIFNISTSSTNLIEDFNLVAPTQFISSNLRTSLGLGFITSLIDFTVPTFSNNLVNYNNNSEYADLTYQFNQTIIDSNGTSGIEFNGVNYTLSNISNSFYKSISGLSVGTYSYYFWAYGSGNNTNYGTSNTYYYTIKQNSSYVLTITGTTPITYPTSTNVVGSNCPNQLSCTLNQTNQIYGVSVQNFNYSTSGNVNYSSNSIIKTITINPSTSLCQVLFNTTSPQNYPINFLVYTNCDSNFNLYRNGSSINNNSNQNLKAGTYNFTVIRIDNQNYSNYNNENDFTINKGIPSLTLTSSQGTWSILASSSNTITGNITPSYLTSSLFKDNSIVANPYTNLFFAGTYVFVFNTTGDENYSSNSISNSLVAGLFGAVTQEQLSKPCKYKSFGYYDPNLPHMGDSKCT